MRATGRRTARERTAARLGTAALAVLAALQVALAVWAGRSAGAADEDVTTLVVWDGFVGAEGAAAQRVYDAFLAANDDVAIERRVLEGEAADPAALRSALASGLGPDVLGTDVGLTFQEELADQRLLVALNELPVRYGWSERVDGVARRWTSRDGRLYALPVDQSFLALYANRALLDEAWLRAPRTATELLDFCRQARGKGLAPFAVGADPAGELADLFAMALNTWLGPESTEDLLVADWARWDTTRVGWALRLVAVEMRDAGCYDPSPSSGQALGEAAPADGRARFVEGGALLWPGSSAVAREVEAAMAGTALEIVPFPTVEGGQGRALPAAPGAAYALAAKSAHPREAAELLDFVVSEEAARIWVEEAGFAPPFAFDVGGWRLTALQASALDLAADARTRPLFRTRAELGYAIDPAATEGFAAALREGLRAVLTGETTPAAAATELQLAWAAEREE